MTKKAADLVPGDDGWTERLGWAYGLISPIPAERSAALDRQALARARTDAARTRYYEAWRRSTIGLLLTARGRAAAERTYEEAANRCLPEALWPRHAPREDTGTWPGLPFALLFLEWEARYPQEWTAHAKAWGTKEFLIRDLAKISHDPDVRAKLIDILDVIVRRPYRCKDREYVRVARAVDGDELRTRLTRAHGSEQPWARRHAGYVLWLLDHPETPNTRHVWTTWLAREREREPCDDMATSCSCTASCPRSAG
ncbi:hypothetical protein [Streptomyces sp. NPDC020298]|uniref:hypothetical protein n=1 Tax=unclassified Streptomyces TaxID=2593676 RepID=UPI0033DD4E43